MYRTFKKALVERRSFACKSVISQERKAGRKAQGARSESSLDIGPVDALGVSRQSVNPIETGKYDPSLPLAFKIADLSVKPIEEIFQRD